MMKYLAYFFISLLSACLIILVSLSSCSPSPGATTIHPTTQSEVRESPTHSLLTSQAQSPGNPKADSVTVKIRNFKFEPEKVTIAVGETVQFINEDEEPHTATSIDGIFDSKALDTHEVWNYTPTKSGTFPYICSVHPFMKGTLTVNPKNH